MHRYMKLTAGITAILALFIFTSAGCYPPPPVYSPTPSGSGDRGGTYESSQTSGGGSQMQSIPTIYPTDNSEASFLRVEGPDIVNGAGQKVFLRGINFGNWLLWEGKSLGIKNDPEFKMRSFLKTQMDGGKVDHFFDAIVKYHTTKQDFQTAKNEGLNVIRLCFHYRYVQEEPTILDEAINWAREAGIYVILNFHAAPGSQAREYFADSDGEMYFWDSRSYQEEFYHKWEILATRYKGDPIIAGYEILNEPDAPRASQVTQVYKEAIQRVRAIDPDHIILLDGNQFAHDPGAFDPPFADNIIYVLHTYEESVRSLKNWVEKNGWLKFKDRYQVPLMCNEYLMSIGANPYFEQEGIHWAPWIYQKTSREWQEWIRQINLQSRQYLNQSRDNLVAIVNSSQLSANCKPEIRQVVTNSPLGQFKDDFISIADQHPGDRREIASIMSQIFKLKDDNWLHAFAQAIKNMSMEQITTLAKSLRDRRGLQFTNP